jgi:hypothetical protein
MYRQSSGTVCREKGELMKWADAWHEKPAAPKAVEKKPR